MNHAASDDETISPEVGRLRGKARLALARRDLLEFIRDRRTLFVTLLLPMAMYPILALSSMLGVRTAMSDLDARMAPLHLNVVLSGDPRAAQALAARIERLFAERPDGSPSRRGWPAGIGFAYASPGRAEDAVESGDATLWIEVPADGIDQLDGTGTLLLEAQGPQSRALTAREREQFSAVMEALAAETRRQRIDRSGLPETLLEPLRVEFAAYTDLPGTVSSREILPTVAGGVFVLLAVLTLTAAFYPAIDAIAGEKERGTIETLLIAPCAAIDIVTGKFLAVWAVALASLVANVISIGLTTAVSLRYLPRGGPLLGGEWPFVILVVMLAFVGLSALSSAMCLAVTTASKSQKEAQNTLTPVLLFASALAGAGLLADLSGKPWLAAVPFGGQVAVARAAIEPPRDPAVVDAQLIGIGRSLLPITISLVSSAVLVWLLLHGTAALLADEEILFRGPDAAAGVLARPARRRRPTVAEGMSALAIGLAGLWYVQGIAPTDFAWAIPVQQAAAVGLPLAVLLLWQRVDWRRTFALAWPGADGGHSLRRTAASVCGGALVGAGLFVLGAAVILAVRGTAVSDETRKLSEKLVTMMREKPPWLTWLLIAIMPAVGEELLFRGWVLSSLVGSWPSRGRAVAGVVVQAACFAAFHLLPERMPQTFALGLFAGAATRTTRSLLPAVVCHAAHNSMPLVLFWLGGGLSGVSIDALPDATASLPPWLMGAAVAAVALGGTLLTLAAGGRSWPKRPSPRHSVAVLTVMLLAGTVASAAAAPPAAADRGAATPDRLRVAVMPLASAVEWAGDEPIGIMIDIWNDLSRRAGFESRLVRIDTLPRLIEALRDQSVDVALGPFAITAERERDIDLTHAIAHSGLRVAVQQRERGGFVSAFSSLLSWGFLQLLAAVIGLAFLSGHFIWWFERHVNPQSFPPQYLRGVWEAVWWIASTIVVGGCDNKHVASVLGRTIAFAWMVGGIVLLASFTSALTAAMTVEQVTGSIHGPKDLAGRTAGCLEASVSVRAIRQRGGMAREFPALEEAIAALEAGWIDAVVGENRQMMALANRAKGEPMKLVGPIFEPFDYGLGLPPGSPLRERIDAAILQMREDGTIDRLHERWLGRHE